MKAEIQESEESEKRRWDIPARSDKSEVQTKPQPVLKLFFFFLVMQPRRLNLWGYFFP